MRKISFSTTAAMLVLATVTLSSPARATDTGTAVGICTSRGTDCTINNKSDGGYHICVNNGGTQQCVDCPPLMSGGSCSVSASQTKGPKKGATVEGVLKQAPAKAKQ